MRSPGGDGGGKILTRRAASAHSEEVVELLRYQIQRC